jgi:hypothetical protein
MEKLHIPKVGEISKFHCEIRKLLGITEDNDRCQDVIFMVPGKNQNFSQWLPLWSDWTRNASGING